MDKFYTGIGARVTPNDVLTVMTKLATLLDNKNYILRSGGADGADTAFELGSRHSEIYVPWKTFNNRTNGICIDNPEATLIAKKYSPHWGYMKDPVKKLMIRNVYQVLGGTLDKPSEFVLCWTKDGCEHYQDRTGKTGGTGLAIEIASRYNIPVINMSHATWRSKLDRVLDNIELYSFK